MVALGKSDYPSIEAWTSFRSSKCHTKLDLNAITIATKVTVLVKCKWRTRMGLFDSKLSSSITSEGDVEKRAFDAIKFDKPKVLLIDVESSAFDALVKVGFNVKEGTFGQPYKVQKTAGFQQLISEPLLPNHTEQEIVIIDLHHSVVDHPIGETHRPEGEHDLWGKCDHGFIDPRVRSTASVIDDFDRILTTGGVFVVFAAQKTPGLICSARKRFRDLEEMKFLKFDEWSFLTELTDMDISSSYGEEMNAVDLNTPIGKLLKSHLSGGFYDCTIRGGYRRTEPWSTLVKNKFNQDVAVFRTCHTNGLIIVLPQLKDKSGFLKSLFTDVLPEMAPHLFPGIEQGRWTHMQDYELPGVVSLNDQRSQITAKFQSDLAALEVQVSQVRKMDGWMHDLLTQTGDPLVSAVQTGLKTLGFKKVVDMDQVRDKLGKSRREDLQIQDTSPTLIVDVKGIANFPGDEDVLQASKHATLLMREQNRTDIFGLSLVNHQRHIPPMQRENEMPFRQELLHVATESQLGLLTAWDFYRLVRSAQVNQWKFEHVQPIIYRHGRFEITPTHYKYLGRVTKVWKDKFGIDIEAGTVEAGGRIAIEFPVLFEETDVMELMVEGNKVTAATVGNKTGIPWSAARPKLREGMRVFKIEN